MPDPKVDPGWETRRPAAGCLRPLWPADTDWSSDGAKGGTVTITTDDDR